MLKRVRPASTLEFTIQALRAGSIVLKGLAKLLTPSFPIGI
jgi:hypothetical protein